MARKPEFAVRKAAVLALLLPLGLAACGENGQGMGQIGGGVIGAALGSFTGSRLGGTAGTIIGGIAGTGLGVWLGGELGHYLSEQDRQRATQAAQTAVVTNQPQVWRNESTGVQGRVQVVQQQTKATQVSVPVSKDRVERVPPLDLIGETYVATSNTNVRAGPDTSYKTVTQLARGEAVTVAGKVQGQSWYMVSRDGVGSGFVPTRDLRSSPSSTVAASGAAPSGPVEQTTVAAKQECRTVRQTIVLADGREEATNVTACQTQNGWAVVSA